MQYRKIKQTLPGRFFLILALASCLLLLAAGYSTAGEDEGYISSADGMQIFYKIVGNGPETLIVVHGGPGNTMDSLLPDLAPLSENHRLIYYDQRGNGRSDLVEQIEELTINKHVEDLEAVRGHFNLARINLLGNSWGGILAGYYAIKYPDRINRLILHCTASPTYEQMRSFAPLITNRIPVGDRERFRHISNPTTWLTSPNPLKICREFYAILTPVYFADTAKAEKMRGNVCSGSREAVSRQQHINNLIWQSLGNWDILPQLQDVTAPTLVIHGEDDMIPVRSSRDWTSALGNARLLIIAGAGHMSHIEQPAIFFKAVEKFLMGEWPDGAVTVDKKNWASS